MVSQLQTDGFIKEKYVRSRSIKNDSFYPVGSKQEISLFNSYSSSLYEKVIKKGRKKLLEFYTEHCKKNIEDKLIQMEKHWIY